MFILVFGDIKYEYDIISMIRGKYYPQGHPQGHPLSNIANDNFVNIIYLEGDLEGNVYL